ncbi:DUF2987 domain-containing protein [Vibrio aestuarianus]|uniref:DUF2987 domain-containing protein n=1 Tax=Vibrio aestuarianus TaxID=28171 RepID=UPI00237CDA52|nr:DUF2987 domain-containing protein [Vibrio aestuarianus]MDE1317937.1 DUF2987 domain-containing protein [Vibrio aestuarianus]
MKKLPLTLLTTLVFSASVSFPIQAQEYMFTYSKLFSQLKNNVKDDYKDVKVGFFFVNAQTKKLCPIEKAWMEKEKHYEELSTSINHELLLPLDDNLRQANPLIFVDTPQDMRCDFSTVVMTKKPFEGQVSYEQVATLLPQMQSLLEELGGMFASWFTPDVSGITLEFANNLDSNIVLSNGQTIAIKNGKAQVAVEQIGNGGYMQLPEQTVRVLPYLPNAKK